MTTPALHRLDVFARVLGAAMLAGLCGAAAAQVGAAVVTPASGPATVRQHADGVSLARGVVRAVSEATLSARLSARIIAMPYAEGESFAQGARLIELDCERPKAEARAAAAAVRAQKKQVETNEELDRFSAIGKNELLVSVAQLEKAQAESEALSSQLGACVLEAPFAGRVVTRLARQHEGVQAGAPLLKIVDTAATELDLIVPSNWLAWMAPGTAFAFRVDETGALLQARVRRLSPNVDPVSRTVRIVAAFNDPKAGVMPGMSGTASGWKRVK